jgi:hypothetical protein
MADLVACEMSYHTAVADYEIGLARARLDLAGRSSPTVGTTQSASAWIWHSSQAERAHDHLCGGGKGGGTEPMSLDYRHR